MRAHGPGGNETDPDAPVPTERAVLPSPTLSPEDVDALVDGIVVYGLDGQVTAANESVLTMLSLTPEQLARRAPLPDGWTAISVEGTPFDTDDNPGKRAIRTGQVQREMLGIQKPDGTTTSDRYPRGPPTR